MSDANFGWFNDPQEVERILEQLPAPLFGDAAPHLEDSGKGKDVFLWMAEKELTGSLRPPHKQAIGDCVSHGFAGAIDDLRFVRIAWNGSTVEGFVETATEAIYGGSRIEIGRGRCGAQDGSVGAWAADWIVKYGIVPRSKYSTIDLTTYSPTLARQWGMKGVPPDLETVAKEYPAKSVSLVRSWEEFRDAIAGAKCPVVICSDQGFSTSRGKDGFCEPKGSWQHCCPATTIISGVETKQICDVDIGDRVFGHDGQLHRVTDVLCRDYDGDLITIKVTGNTPFSFTTEHPLYVLRSGEAKWIKAENLRLSDQLLSPRFTFDNVSIEPWIDVRGQNIPNEITAPSKELAFMFGYYIANGHIKKGHGIGFTMPLHNRWIADRVVSIFNNILNIYPRIKVEHNCVRVLIDAVTLESTFKEWFGDYSHTKKIPLFLFTWPNDCREALIEGMYYGDSNTHNNAVTYTTVSPVLMRQLWHLQIMAGRYIKADYNDKVHLSNYSNGKPLHHLYYYEDANKPQTKYTVIGGVEYYVMPVRRISSHAYKSKVYNLSVVDVESYIADGMAVHNCTYFRGVSDNPKRPGGTYQQSWGPGMPTGSTRVTLPHGLDLEMPEGAFFVDAHIINRMVRQNDSFVVADIVGYPARPDLDFDFKLY